MLTKNYHIVCELIGRGSAEPALQLLVEVVHLFEKALPLDRFQHDLPNLDDAGTHSLHKKLCASDIFLDNLLHLKARQVRERSRFT